MAPNVFSVSLGVWHCMGCPSPCRIAFHPHRCPIYQPGKQRPTASFAQQALVSHKQVWASFCLMANPSYLLFFKLSLESAISEEDLFNLIQPKEKSQTCCWSPKWGFCVSVSLLKVNCTYKILASCGWVPVRSLFEGFIHSYVLTNVYFLLFSSSLKHLCLYIAVLPKRFQGISMHIIL